MITEFAKNTYFRLDGYIVGLTSKGEEFYIDDCDYEKVSRYREYEGVVKS